MISIGRILVGKDLDIIDIETVPENEYSIFFYIDDLFDNGYANTMLIAESNRYLYKLMYNDAATAFNENPPINEVASKLTGTEIVDDCYIIVEDARKSNAYTAETDAVIVPFSIQMKTYLKGLIRNDNR